MKTKQIKRAIISVSNKSYLKIILPILKTYKIEIISSGGTYKKIKSMNYKCIEVSDYTGFPEILNGRIKTLHPKIHAGILNIRKNKLHKKTLREKNIPNIDLVIIDSVAALVPRAEIEGEMGDHHVGLQARLMSQALRKITGNIQRSGATVVFINQIRMKIGVMFGSPETTTGGNALKFYSSVRLDIRRIGAVKEGDEVTGNETRVKVVKIRYLLHSNKLNFK